MASPPIILLDLVKNKERHRRVALVVEGYPVPVACRGLSQAQPALPARALRTASLRKGSGSNEKGHRKGAWAWSGKATQSRSRVVVYRRHSLLCPLALCGTSLRKKSPPGSFSLLTQNCPGALCAPLHFAGVTPPTTKKHPKWGASSLEAPPGIEPGIEVLQTFALPLGHGAGLSSRIL